jgi:Tfp pilus assembly protein FimT
MIELLAVAALVGILASISVLRYSKMGSQTVLTNQARQLYLIAKYARIAAIEKQTVVALKLDEAQQQLYLEAAMSTPPSDTSMTAMPQMGTLPGQVESPILKNAYTRPLALDKKLLVEQFMVDGMDGRQTQSLFFPDGKAQACLIQLGDGLRHAHVMVSQTGRVTMQNGMAGQLLTGRVDLDAQE